MEYENFPKIGFGTWTMGGDVVPNPNNDDKRDIEAIKYVISKGVSHIDTAANYADGKSEELVGRAIKDFDREKLFIATKVKPEDLAFDDVIKSCERSLKNLDTPWVDLLYVHKPNPEIEIKETAKAFNELFKRGVIKNIGLSNVKLKQFWSMKNIWISQFLQFKINTTWWQESHKRRELLIFAGKTKRFLLLGDQFI